jgi:hypothetical protein
MYILVTSATAEITDAKQNATQTGTAIGATGAEML